MITIEDINLIIRAALFMVIKMSLPVLLTSMVIGLVISIFQTVTSIQEQTLTFVPKMVGIFLTIMFLGGWMMNNIVEYATGLWTTFSYYVHR